MLNFQLILRHNQMLLTLILNKLAFVLNSYLTPMELIASSQYLAVESQNGIIECLYFILFSSTVNPEVL